MISMLINGTLLQGTSVLVMHVEVVATLVQDLAAISEGELVRKACLWLLVSGGFGVFLCIFFRPTLIYNVFLVLGNL